MSTIVEIADAVVAHMLTRSFSQPFTPERTFQPIFDLADLETVQVSVVPRTMTITASSRNLSQYECTIDIGIQKRLEVGTIDQVQIDALLDLVEEIADAFRFERLSGYRDAAWVSVTNEPVVAAEHLDQHRQFTSLLTLTYRVLR
jgi:hypothetical protein